MLYRAVVTASLLAVAATLQPQPKAGIVGTWQLVSRIDRDATGQVISETTLGSGPIGYLIYDAAGHASAQIAERVGLERSSGSG